MDHPLSFLRNCLYNIFAATLHSWRPSFNLHIEDDPCCGDQGTHGALVDNIKRNLLEIGWGCVDGLFWLRIGKSGEF
jgi:hypothetical protein